MKKNIELSDQSHLDIDWEKKVNLPNHESTEVVEEENQTEIVEDNNVNGENISRKNDAKIKNGKYDDFLNDWN